MSDWRKIQLPMTAKTVAELRAGDKLLLSGTIYAARDAAHKRFVEALDRGEKLPIDLSKSVIYYMGPSPTRPGDIVGACGPTTSARMDKYTPRLLTEGLRVMMGKGDRSLQVVEAIKKYRGVYLITIGGAGALLSLKVKSSEIVAYPDLGTEAVLKMEVENFPAIVAVDSQGNDFCKIGPSQYRTS
ncbi:Fe-S-containing hydro-lyase [Dehalogenimonas etheniformans]|uniref:Fumarate hydratase n=1 Tax=Dehalogenimonas etheniformans TaxID=1536648 RepID=A0A2P5P8M9_9CHLR|nr:Fe-S-containing hydro-lyase [Dehalogenimonas etheniformans]PPD58649.1 fumarate hydratase [Dehalogenimonas etheniformans]QNT76580.1 Fe-S-containing hydro-lyase [Dehalogenimonas etheniformans]